MVVHSRVGVVCYYQPLGDYSFRFTNLTTNIITSITNYLQLLVVVLLVLHLQTQLVILSDSQ